MPDQPKPPEAWLPLMIDLGGQAPPAPVAAAAPAPAAVPAVGEEVTAYCPSPRCKTNQTHTIISMYEDEIRRVQCVMCGEVHAFRKPRDQPAEAPPVQRSWDDAIAGFSDDARRAAPPYSIRNTYAVGDLVQHPVYEVGVVVEILTDGKVEVLFRERSVVLVHGR